MGGFSLESFSLSGSRALVTGGNTGLGHGFSAALAAAGADVAVAGLAADDGMTRAAVEGHSRRYAFRRTDLTESGAPTSAVQWCVEELGGIDILVNNAGLNLLADDVRDFDRKLWDPMIELNLSVAFEMSHAAAGFMIEQHSGKMINIASLYSFRGGQRSPAYAATKHGIVGLTRAYCDELAEHGICVNAIAPGYVATELTRTTRENPKLNKAVTDRVPANRWAEPEDLMGALVFLASSASDFVNGQVLTVDGGYLVR